MRDFGSFLSDGEHANAFRFCEVEPAINRGDVVAFDFEGVTNMTDSFCNALFGTLVEEHPELLDGKIQFQNCLPLIQDFIQRAITLAQSDREIA